MIDWNRSRYRLGGFYFTFIPTLLEGNLIDFFLLIKIQNISAIGIPTVHLRIKSIHTAKIPHTLLYIKFTIGLKTTTKSQQYINIKTLIQIYIRVLGRILGRRIRFCWSNVMIIISHLVNLLRRISIIDVINGTSILYIIKYLLSGCLYISLS